METAEPQVRRRIVMRHAAPLAIGLQARDRLEILALVVIEERVAEVQIAHDRGRKLVDLLLGRQGRRRKRRRQRQQGAHRHDNAAERRHPCASYSQSLMANSGCALRWRSVILSSRYFAPTPFSNLRLAPRL